MPAFVVPVTSPYEYPIHNQVPSTCHHLITSSPPIYPSTALSVPSFSIVLGSPVHIDSRAREDGSSDLNRFNWNLGAENHARRRAGKKMRIKRANRRRRRVISINMLPDDVLLAIFDSCADKIEAWQSLVHVCQRWRSVVFGSPRHLNLRLLCTGKTPAKDTMDVWPALPLLIQDRDLQTEYLDNIIALLGYGDRVYQINLINVPSSHLEKVSAAMQKPFLELQDLLLWSHGTVMVLPDSFLGGSAPRLKFLRLNGIPFPGIQNLLMSTTRLVTLRLWNIPHSGYISPEVMAVCLSTLARLEILSLGFQSPQSCPGRESRRLPPPTRFVLPLLTYFGFKGVTEYLDDIVGLVDVPRLEYLDITFFNQIIFDTPQFIHFISRTPTLKPLEKARVAFQNGAARVNLSSDSSCYGRLDLKIPCRELDWQVSSLEQVCTSCFPPLSTPEDLYVYKVPYSKPDWQDNIDNALWLEFLRPFTAVKNLYLSEEFGPQIMPALQELVGDRTTEVLPSLENIFLEGLEPSGPGHDDIGQFVATRQVTTHPIAVSLWDNSMQDKVLG